MVVLPRNTFNFDMKISKLSLSFKISKFCSKLKKKLPNGIDLVFYFGMANKTVKELKARTTFIKVIIGQLVEIKIFRLDDIFSNFTQKFSRQNFAKKFHHLHCIMGRSRHETVQSN